MASNLTKKEKGFIKDYIKTGNGSLAVRNNYDVSNDNVAGVIAYENIRKPKIKKVLKSIADSIPDSLLIERHLELLNKRDTVLGSKQEDGTYNRIDLGPEVQGVSKGLDMAYKLKKQYADTKDTTINLNLIQGVEITVRKDDKE